jgi:hypothetical protein
MSYIKSYLLIKDIVKKVGQHTLQDIIRHMINQLY